VWGRKIGSSEVFHLTNLCLDARRGHSETIPATSLAVLRVRCAKASKRKKDVERKNKAGVAELTSVLVAW
jgi:hypothetical protein